MKTLNREYPVHLKLIHLGLAVFGITAYLTAELAENGIESLGYLLHSYLGLSLAATLIIRIILGFQQTELVSFKEWSIFSKQQWQFALEDLKTLVKFNVPDRVPHQGLAGLTQAFGLILFTWMSLTGIIMFILETDTSNNVFELIEEAHEIGESLIPLYLIMHVGAVILHTLSGHAIWQRMFSFINNNINKN